jgi:hypothetical protein
MDWKCNEKEVNILKDYKIIPCKAYPLQLSKSPSYNIPDKWEPPLEGFIKMNFDGASKGNLGHPGFVGVFRNEKGEILGIYAGYLGIERNNTTELYVL